MDTSETSVNTANNTSVISWNVYIYEDSNTASYDLGTTSNWAASINGVSVGSGNYSYDFRGTSAGYSLALGSGTYTYTHLSDGTGTPTIAVSSNAASPLGSASGSSTQAVTNISRPPQAPAAPSITRPKTGTNQNGTTITVSSQVASSATGSPAPPAITDYKYRYSTDNSTWTEVTGMGTGRVSTFGPTVPAIVSGTQVYYFQTAAYNSEGWGAWSPSGVAYAAPTISSLTRSGAAVTVAVTPASSNGGSTITSHVVESSSDLSTWTSQTISGASGGTTTFSALSPGKTWYFRAYATNAAGINSPYTDNQSVFVAAYGKRYSGTTTGAITNITTTTKYGAITYVYGDGESGFTRFTVGSNSSLVAGDLVTVSGIAAPYAGLNRTYYVSYYSSVDGYFETSFGYDIDTGVSGNYATVGGDITYTASNEFVAGDAVNITGVTPSQYNLTNATIKSATSTQFVITNSATGVIQNPKTGTAANVNPLIWKPINTGKRYDSSGGGAGIPGWVDIQTAKKYASAAVVAPGVSGTGSVVTYNATAHPYSVGDVVSITGVAPTAYNLTNVTITAIATNSFTVNNAATGAYSSGGTIVGWATFK